MKSILCLIIGLIISIPSSAKILQEGWYKVFIGNSPMGYLVHKYEFDEKSKQFKSAYFMKFNALGGNKTESLSAVSTQKLNPVSYQYTNREGDTTKTIDAVFKKDLMEGTIVENGKPQKIQKKLEKGTLLSSFLVYLMLNNPSGIKKDSTFSYKAIAEEDGSPYGGNIHIKDEEVIMGQNTFKTINNFKGDQWISHITADGVMLSTRSPVLGIRTELSTKAEATKGFPSNEKILNQVFKTIPGDSFYNKYAASMKSIQESSPTPPPSGTPNPEKAEQMKKIEDIKSDLPKRLAIPPGKGGPTPFPDEP